MIGLILDHLWQSTLFAAAAGALTLTLQRNSAQSRYLLWFAASMKFLIPFAALTWLGKNLLVLAAPPVTAPALLAFQPVAEPFSARALNFAPVAPAGFDVAAAVTPLLLAVWGIGSLFMLARWLMRWAGLRRLVREAADYAFAAPVRVKMAPTMLEPGLVGIARPVILLPQGIDERLSPAELNAIIAHEICHLRRGDNALAAAHMLVEALFWFHPLVWWMGARLNKERERACDESVLSSGLTPDLYAESILKVCKFYLHSPLDCAAGISGADLKRRMETIMENRFLLRLNTTRKILLAGCAAIAVAAPIAAGLLASPPVLAQIAVARATPSPGTEAALRQFIEGQQMGNPPYDLFTPALAQRIRNAPPQDHGKLKSLTFKGVYNGADAYAAEYEKAKITWLVAPLVGGKIAGLGSVETVERAPGTENSPSPGVQEALRQLLDSRYRNQVRVDLLGDAIAARFAQGRTPLGESSESFQALGPMQSLTFLKVDALGNDLYRAVYPHGHATWIIPPLVNGKIDNLLWGDVLIDNAPAHPGTEEAVRRFVEGAQSGTVDYSQMDPIVAVGQRRAADELKRLGALKSLTYKGGFRTLDVYEASFANGTTNFSAGVGPKGNIQVMSDLASNG